MNDARSHPRLVESALLEHIRARSAHARAGAGWELETGPGDDAAVLAPPRDGRTIVTVDQLIEGVHYSADTAIGLVGRKAMARSVSDVAAMGGAPAWSLGTIAAPAAFAHADELFDAMSTHAQTWGAPLIGGDVAVHARPSDPVVITTTVVAHVPAGSRPVLRSGAKAGDAVYLTGPVGGSLESGRHLTFEPRLHIGAIAAREGSGVNAMIDCSDGLGVDAARLGAASGAVLEIETARVPLHDGVAGWREGVCAGEDYELVMCVEETAEPIEGLLGPIGRVRAPRDGDAPGARLIEPDGSSHDAAAFGWDHGARDGH